MSDSNPEALFDYAADQLNRFGLAYLHIIEPRVKGNILVAEGQVPVASEQLRPVFSDFGFNRAAHKRRLLAIGPSFSAFAIGGRFHQKLAQEFRAGIGQAAAKGSF